MCVLVQDIALGRTFKHCDFLHILFVDVEKTNQGIIVFVRVTTGNCEYLVNMQK